METAPGRIHGRVNDADHLLPLLSAGIILRMNRRIKRSANKFRLRRRNIPPPQDRDEYVMPPRGLAFSRPPLSSGKALMRLAA